MQPLTLADLLRKWLVRQLASDRTPISAVVGAYQLSVTQFTCGVNAQWVNVLPSDTRRVYLRFITNTAFLANRLLLPGPTQNALTAQAVSNTDNEWKFRDSPATVTAEWNYFGGLNDRLVIIQELKTSG